MRRYEEYKEVELRYFEIIPSNWKLGRLCDVLSSKTYSFTGGPFGSDLKSNDYTDDGIRIIQLQNIGVGKFLNEYKIYTSVEKANALFACNIFPGDIIIAKMADPVARATIIPDYHSRYLMASDGIRLVNNNFNDSRFLVYAINSIHFNFYASINSVGSTRQRIGLNVLKKLNIILPPLSEQQAIANYLDAKTQAIDKKVSLLEQKIETYKKLKRTLINQTITKGLNKNVPLKDSGISWIGQIPQHWEVKRFKDVLNLFTGNSISDKNGFDYIENSIPYVSTKDIDFNTNEINYTNGMYIPNSDKTFKRAKKGTCLICIEGANAGKKYGILNQEVAFVNKLAALKFKANRNFDKYLYYYIQSIAFSGEFFPLINGLIGGVSVNKLKEFNIILPPKSEQEEIAKYLDHKTATIDAIVGNISKQIETLKQLRKTLINDVVTGKIKVCDD